MVGNQYTHRQIRSKFLYLTRTQASWKLLYQELKQKFEQLKTTTVEENSQQYKNDPKIINPKRTKHKTKVKKNELEVNEDDDDDQENSAYDANQSIEAADNELVDQGGACSGRPWSDGENTKFFAAVQQHGTKLRKIVKQYGSTRSFNDCFEYAKIQIERFNDNPYLEDSELLPILEQIAQDPKNIRLASQARPSKQPLRRSRQAKVISKKKKFADWKPW